MDTSRKSLRRALSSARRLLTASHPDRPTPVLLASLPAIAGLKGLEAKPEVPLTGERSGPVLSGWSEAEA